MNTIEEILSSRKNREKAVNSIPIRLIEKEDKLLSRVKASKKSAMQKLSDLYRFTDQMAQSFQHLTPCKRGCSFCCYIRVDISELEVNYIKKHAKKALKNLPKKLVIGEPCPFLKSGACSIYEVRPFACRRHQVFTPTNQLCMPDQENGQELLTFTEIDKSFKYIVSKYASPEFSDIRNAFNC